MYRFFDLKKEVNTSVDLV